MLEALSAGVVKYADSTSAVGEGAFLTIFKINKGTHNNILRTTGDWIQLNSVYKN